MFFVRDQSCIRIGLAYGLEGCDLAFATRDVVNNEASSGLASVLVIEEIPISYQCKQRLTVDWNDYLLGI